MAVPLPHWKKGVGTGQDGGVKWVDARTIMHLTEDGAHNRKARGFAPPGAADQRISLMGLLHVITRQPRDIGNRQQLGIEAGGIHKLKCAIEMGRWQG